MLLLDPTSGCRGGFKAPSLDNQVNIRSTGLLGQRVHVNVDFDTERDYSSNNNVQIYYEGLQDEIVRRIDVGTVVFQPPPSRFITAAVPANNFGINATFEVGPMQIQTLAATQKGSVVAERTYTVGATTSQSQDRQMRDLDFESGRFFWVIDPDSLPGYPALDILGLNPRLALAELPPGAGARVSLPGSQQQERRQSRISAGSRRWPAGATAPSASDRCSGSCCFREPTTTSTHPDSGSPWPPSSIRTTTWP